jgi:hypothetical protein
MSSFLKHYRSSFSPALQVANVVLFHKLQIFLLTSIAGSNLSQTLQIFLLTSIAGSKCRPFSQTTVLPPHQHYSWQMLSFLTHYSSFSSPALQVANVVLSQTLQIFLLTSIAGSKCCPFSNTTDLPSLQHCR